VDVVDQVELLSTVLCEVSRIGIPDSSYALTRKHIHQIHLIHRFRRGRWTVCDRVGAVVRIRRMRWSRSAKSLRRAT
jgi:hypothetical protein